METINRRDFLKLSGAAGVALAAGPQAVAAPQAVAGPQAMAAPGTAKPARPNILVFLTDDHGQWAEHAYGNSELKTPHMDRLAAQGVRMTQAFTPCPVCSPARASFFTGRMPSQHGIADWLNDTQCPDHPGLKGQTLISELLQNAGYHTGLVGKWHCGAEREPKPGFDRYFSYWVSQYPHRGTQNFSDQGQHVVETGQQSPLLTERAVGFLQARKKDAATAQKPFFLFVGYVDTHTPHNEAPDDLVAQYQSATFHDIPEEEPAACHGRVVEARPKRPEIEHAKRTEYYAAVSSIDREIGKVLAALEANGEMENTLVVYTGDHGLNCGQHGVWEKGNATLPQNFLEESVRVACTVSWPAGGIQQNTVCEDLVNHCDLWATLLEVAGATPDTKTAAEINSPGRSYLPQLHGHRPADWTDTQISEYGNARMLRTKRYKLILRYPFENIDFANELYDLQNDPRETVNRYTDPALSPLVTQLTAHLNAFFAKYTVPGHSGLDLATLPVCNFDSPWTRAVSVDKVRARLPARDRRPGGRRRSRRRC